MAELRRFREDGVVAFTEYLRNAPHQPSLAPPFELLTDTRYSEAVGRGAVVEHREFGSKREFAQYIDAQFGTRVPREVLHFSKPMWGWLTLFYFDQICPVRDGKRKVLASIERYYGVGTGMSHHLDKHLLYLPWKLHSLHGVAAEWLLSGELGTDSKVLRELANSYRRNVSKVFVALAKALYFDTDTGQVLSGATTNPNKTKGGTLR